MPDAVTEVVVEAARRCDLPRFQAMEQDAEVRPFVLARSLDEHEAQFGTSHIHYLRILAIERLAGFVVLAEEPDGASVELRRIVVAPRDRGIGKRAIAAVERWCGQRLARRRIWLDVFADNARGRHLYETLGYRRFGETRLEGRRLLLYEKPLP